MSLLNKIVSVLPVAYRLSIKSLLARKKKLKEITTKRQEVLSSKKLLADISKGGPILNPKYASPDNIISSNEHNSNFEQIYIDLYSLYKEADSLGRISKEKQVVINSNFLKSKAAIEKLINDSRIYSLRRKYKEFNEFNIIDFNISRNISKIYPQAKVDPKTRLLELPVIHSSKTSVINRGEDVTVAYTKTVGKGIRATSSEFPVSNIIDNRPDTFWVTNILSDNPSKIVYEGEEYTGQIIEVFINYSKVEHLNVIRILPFSEFPIKLIGLSYRASQDSQVFRDIEFNEPEPTLDWIEINFNPVYVHELKVSLLQENFKEFSFLLPRDLALNTDLFEQIASSQLKKLAGTLNIDSDLRDQILNSDDLYSTAKKELADLLGNVSLDDSINSVLLNEKLQSISGEILSILDTNGNVLILEELFKKNKESEVARYNKLEYTVGLREIETAYEVYAPYAYYTSEKYKPQATVAELAIEVDQQNQNVDTSWGKFNKTSTEWIIDFGENREIPIHPRNLVDSKDNPIAEDELLKIDKFTLKGSTRLSSRFATPLSIKQDGKTLPISAYTATRNITTKAGSLDILLKEKYWNENSLYTISYDVADISININTFDLFTPRDLVSLEEFSKTDSDKRITLKRYPFISYEVINREGTYFESKDNKWNFSSPKDDYNLGLIEVNVRIIDSLGVEIRPGNATATTIPGSWGDRNGQIALDVSTVDTQYFISPFGYFTQIQGTKPYWEINNFNSTNTVVFKSIPTFTIDQLKQMPAGAISAMDLTVNPPTGNLLAEYTLGIGITLDDKTYTISDTVYEPIKIIVGGIEAKNITNYKSLEHPAFSVTAKKDKDYEYIQAGNRIYFNQPISSKIQVDYKWLTEYITIKSILRCNLRINPDTTPKVDEVRVLINNTTI
jgi:hypothetical protein